MRITWFHIQGSPNCAVARLALAHRGISAREVELPIGWHRVLLRLLGFRGGTVPAARVDGRRLQGSTDIMRAVDAGLFSSPAVEEAERWGAEYVQTVPRRIVGKLIRRAPEHARSFTPAGLTGRLPNALVAAATGPTLRFQAWRLRAGGEAELREALAEVPAMLDRVQELLDGGTLSTSSPSAADFQIAPQLRMLDCLEDFTALFQDRPRLAGWMRAVVPDYPGRLPPVLTPDERALLS